MWAVTVAVLAAASTQFRPAVQSTTSGDIVIEVQSNLKVAQWNTTSRSFGTTASVVTTRELSGALSYQSNFLQASQAQLSVNVAAAISSAASTVRSEIAASLDTLRRDTATNNSILGQELSTLSAVVTRMQEGMSSTSCGNYTLRNGTALGYGTNAGALRVLRCDQGLHLEGVETPTIVCHTDGQWSDGGNASCVQSEPPTTTPPPQPEMVRCHISADEAVVSAFVDTQQLALDLNNTIRIDYRGGYAGRYWVINFPPSHHNLGIRVRNDGGCPIGFFLIGCGTPSGQPSRWNFWTPGVGTARDSNPPLGRGGGVYSRKWSVRTINPPTIPPEDGLWTRPAATAPAGFVAPHVRNANPRVMGSSRFTGLSPVQLFQMGTGPQRLLAPNASNSHLLAARPGTMCGGDNLNRVRTTWLFLYRSTTQA